MGLERRAKYDYAGILPSIGVFGGVRRFLEIGNELIRRGHTYTLYTPQGEMPSWLPFEGGVKPVSALPSADPDIAICNDPTMVEDLRNSSARHKFFYCVLENIRDERAIVRDTNLVMLSNSTGMTRRLKKKFGVRAEPVVGGINLRTFQPREAVDHGYSMGSGRAGQLADNPFRILAYGRASRPRKGLSIVLEALRSHKGLRIDGRAIQLVLFDHVGVGNEEDPREMVRTDLPTEFHLNLSQPDLAALYRSCDLFISAEKRAGWSNTVAEAMASGVPVICTKSGTADLAIHKETAWILSFRHALFLKHAIREVAKSSDLRERMRANALKHIQSFSWGHVVDQLEAVVSKMNADLSAT